MRVHTREERAKFTRAKFAGDAGEHAIEEECT
jgi:hypothetical protein